MKLMAEFRGLYLVINNSTESQDPCSIEETSNSCILLVNILNVSFFFRFDRKVVFLAVRHCNGK